MPFPAVVPPIPGFSKTEGPAPGSMRPEEMISMLMGLRPSGFQATGDKLAQVVQLLREVKAESPQLASLVGGALRALIEGPPLFMAEASGPGQSGTPGGLISAMQGGVGRTPY